MSRISVTQATQKRHSRGRRGVVVTALLLVLASFSGGSPASAYPVSQGSLAVSNASGPTSTARPGESLTLSGGGFAPGATVTITLDPTPGSLRTIAADGSGSFTATIVVPTGTSSGAYNLKASGAAPAGGVVVLSKVMRIGATSGSGSLPATLPFTGSQTARVVALGAVLTVGGAGMVLLGLRRRRVAA